MVREIRALGGNEAASKTWKYLYCNVYLYATVTMQRLELYNHNIMLSM